MEVLGNAIEAGFLPQDTAQLVATGKITADWLRKNLTSNREFMIGQLPDRIREKILNGKNFETFTWIFFETNLSTSDYN